MRHAECATEIFSLGREMVRRGMATLSDDAPYAYAEASQIAQNMQSGLWASQFVPPSEWRKANPEAAPQTEKSAVAPLPNHSPPMRVEKEREYRNEFGCAIKGNRSRRGDWIYHLPGRPYYKQTRPEELFCTESEARAAGYRRSKA